MFFRHLNVKVGLENTEALTQIIMLTNIRHVFTVILLPWIQEHLRDVCSLIF